MPPGNNERNITETFEGLDNGIRTLRKDSRLAVALEIANEQLGMKTSYIDPLKDCIIKQSEKIERQKNGLPQSKSIEEKISSVIKEVLRERDYDISFLDKTDRGVDTQNTPTAAVASHENRVDILPQGQRINTNGSNSRV